MYYHQKLFLLALLCCFSSILKVQAETTISENDTLTVSLEEVWKYAENQNKLVKASQYKVADHEERIRNARAEQYPEINTGTKYARISNLPIYENGIFNKPEYFPVLHNYFQLNADASVVIYNGQKLKTELQEAKVEKEIALLEKGQTVSDVKFKATAYYLELERNIEFRKLVLANIAEQQKRLEQMRELFKNGVILRSDVLRAEVALSKQQMLLTEIKNTITINNEKLAVLIGLPEVTWLKPDNQENSQTDSTRTYEDYLDEAVTHAYGLRISEKETELKQLSIKVAKANSLPKVSAYAEYGYTYPQIFLYPYAAALYGIGQAGVKISYNLSSVYQNKHKVKSAEIQAKTQQLLHHDEEDVLRTRVHEAFTRYHESLERISVAEQNIRQTTETYRIVYQTYFNQLALLTDLLDSDTQLLQSRFDLTSARIRAKLEYYYLMKTIGTI